MFGTMPGMLTGAGGDWEWSGAFPYPAPDHTELIEYLGLTSLAPGSHIWQMEKGQSVDIGSLATTDFDFQTAVDCTYSPDANFAKGVPDIAHVGTTFDSAGMTTYSGSFPIPDPMDGTRAFLVGGLCQIDSMPGAEAFANLCSKMISSGSGWLLSAYDATSGDTDVPLLQFSVFQNSFGTVDQLNGPNHTGPNYGEPFAFLAGVNNGKMFVMTSTAGSYAEMSWTDTGTYTHVQGVKVGSSDMTGANDSYSGLMGQLFTLEWPIGTDAGIDYSTMTRFLKYVDGYLVV